MPLPVTCPSFQCLARTNVSEYCLHPSISKCYTPVPQRTFQYMPNSNVTNMPVNRMPNMIRPPGRSKCASPKYTADRMYLYCFHRRDVLKKHITPGTHSPIQLLNNKYVQPAPYREPLLTKKKKKDSTGGPKLDGWLPNEGYKNRQDSQTDRQKNQTNIKRTNQNRRNAQMDRDRGGGPDPSRALSINANISTARIPTWYPVPLCRETY